MSAVGNHLRGFVTANATTLSVSLLVWYLSADLNMDSSDICRDFLPVLSSAVALLRFPLAFIRSTRTTNTSFRRAKILSKAESAARKHLPWTGQSKQQKDLQVKKKMRLLIILHGPHSMKQSVGSPCLGHVCGQLKRVRPPCACLLVS